MATSHLSASRVAASSSLSLRKSPLFGSSKALSIVHHRATNEKKSLSKRQSQAMQAVRASSASSNVAVAAAAAEKTYRVTLLPGDGIGPEIMAVAVTLLQELGKLEGEQRNEDTRDTQMQLAEQRHQSS